MAEEAVPAPAPELTERLPEPDKAAHQAKVAAIQEQIAKKQERMVCAHSHSNCRALLVRDCWRSVAGVCREKWVLPFAHEQSSACHWPLPNYQR